MPQRWLLPLAATVVAAVVTLAVVIACLTIRGSTAVAAPAQPVASVAVEHTSFRITLADGTVLPQEALPGTVLAIGDGSGRQRHIRIDAVEHDPKDPTGDVILYAMSEQDAATGQWRNACQPDPDGRRLGFPLAGAFTAQMRHVDMPGRLLITCTGGAEGKCIRFGYAPWHQAPDGASLAPYYQACVRMVRADYCGDGVGNTRNGTPIDLFDRIGIQQDEPAPGMTLEAAWNSDGAVCVGHTRLPDVRTMASLDALCPAHVAARCDETVPALLYNRSFGR